MRKSQRELYNKLFQISMALHQTLFMPPISWVSGASFDSEWQLLLF